jgi:hypothetical protein
MGWGEEVMQFRRASQTLLETGRVAEPYLPFVLFGLDPDPARVTAALRDWLGAETLFA